MKIEKKNLKFRYRLFNDLCIALIYILLQVEDFSYTPHSDNIRILIL